MKSVGIACALVVMATVAVFALPQTFRASIEAVRVDALVTEGNRPVAGLSVRDFDVLDSGMPQQLDAVLFEEVPLRVMLVLDTSDSVKGEPLGHLKEAATAVARMLTPDDRSALLAFSSVLTLRVSWSSDHEQIVRAVNGAEAQGATGVHDAAYAALTLRDTEPGRRLILVFTDGDDNASWLPGQSVIDVAQRNDAVVYAVGPRPRALRPGHRIDFTSGPQIVQTRLNAALAAKSFLDELTDETGGKYITTTSSSELRETFVRIVSEFRSRYLLVYTPRAVDANGWHPIEVRVKGRRLNVIARRGYLR